MLPYRAVTAGYGRNLPRAAVAAPRRPRPTERDPARIPTPHQHTGSPNRVFAANVTGRHQNNDTARRRRRMTRATVRLRRATIRLRRAADVSDRHSHLILTNSPVDKCSHLLRSRRGAIGLVKRQL